MLDRFLRKWSIKFRIFSVYLAVGLGLIFLLLGTVDYLGTLFEWFRESGSEGVVFPLFDALPSRIKLFMPVAIVLFVIGLVWSLIIGKSLNQQIKELREKVDLFRKGNLDVSFSEDDFDEINLLSQSLNNLIVEQVASRSKDEEINKQNLNLLGLRELQLRMVGELAREISNIRNLDILLNRSINLIKSRLNYYYVCVYLVDEERRFLHLMAGTGEAGSYHLSRKRSLKVGEVGIITGVLNSGAPRLLNDVRSDYIFRQDFMLPETRSEIALPLRAGKDVMGVLDIQSDQEQAFVQDDVAIIQILADQLALAVQNARLIQNLQRSVREANSIYRRYAQRVWSREMIGNRPVGFQYDTLQVLPLDQKLPENVINRLSGGHPVSLPLQELGQASSENGGTILLAPVMVYNQLVGVIGMEQENADYDWGDEEVSLIEAITNQVSLALDNARLLEETQLRSTQMRVLQEITSVAASHTNLIELLDHVSQKVRVSFDLLHCGMFLIDPDGSSLSLVASASSDPFVPGVNMLGAKIMVQDNSILTSVFETRTSKAVYNVFDEPIESSVREFLQLRKVNTVAFIPLQSMSAVIGVASLEVGEASRKFSDEDLRLFDQISLQISSAIDVARSFEHETHRAERERKVGEVASRMRETLDIDAVMRTAVQEIRRAFEISQVEVYIDQRYTRASQDRKAGQSTPSDFEEMDFIEMLQGEPPQTTTVSDIEKKSTSALTDPDSKQSLTVPESGDLEEGEG